MTCMRSKTMRIACGLVAIGSANCMSQAIAQLTEGSIRRTPLVKVIESAEKTVVGLFTIDAAKSAWISGSGAIVNPNGYVLTNNHVVPSKEGYAVYEGKAIPFRVVGRLPERDLALVKLSGEHTWPDSIVGRNNDLMNGETVVTAGNPGGRGIVFTAGIVSNKSMMTNAGNALVMSQFSPIDGRDKYIQFDAASNPGNSGGPLIDLESRLIGIVSGSFSQEQNVNYAIPIDRVRASAMALIEPEVRHQRRTGITIDPNADGCLVESVEAKSSASEAGVKKGDVIVSVGGRKVRQILDWVIAMDLTLPGKSKMEMEIRSADEIRSVSFLPQAALPFKPVIVEEPQPGLRYKIYAGSFTRMPNFPPMSIEQEGTVDQFLLSLAAKKGRENFAAIFDGFLDINTTALYRVAIISDDGSKLFAHEQLLVDNDFNHPPQPASRLVRLESGLHPISIQYYQATGGAELAMTLSRVDESTWEETPVNPIFVRAKK